jgi:GNAT superfamily N-acetyltransferase
VVSDATAAPVRRKQQSELSFVEMGAERVVLPMRAPLHVSVEPPLPAGVALRPLRPTDTRTLATLMAVAYAGTIDDHGEPPSFAAAEAQRTVAGNYGEVQWEASLLAHTSGHESVGTTVVTWDRGHLLLAFTLVAPEWRNQGLGTALIIRTANHLAAQGATEWTLAVTDGNPAQRLYERLGFRVDRTLLRQEQRSPPL